VPPKLPTLRAGQEVRVDGVEIPYTFWPDAYIKHGRVVTADPWRCLALHIRRSVRDTGRRNKALAFLDQAEEFYRAGAAPQLASKPLLYYYCFMNLAKVLLVVKREEIDLTRCFHGLREGKDNVRKRLRIQSQAVEIDQPRGPGRVSVYTEFVKECGFEVQEEDRPTKLLDLLEQTVSIHRITSQALEHERRFFPVDRVAFECCTVSKKAWVALHLRPDDLAAYPKALDEVCRRSAGFHRVNPIREGLVRLESDPVAYEQCPSEALGLLARATWSDIWSELCPGRYRFWVSTIPKRQRLAQVASGYQAMFYFGSVARYRPDDYRKLAEGEHGWMVQEFINSQPVQFIYLLGSGIMDAEMVMPELVLR